MSDTAPGQSRCLCHRAAPVDFADPVTGRGYCAACAMNEATSTRHVHLQWLAALLPLAVGERVQCCTVGEFYDGDGEIVEISTEVIHGGTPVHPAYLVQLDDGRRWWYTSCCLTRTTSRRVAP